MAKIAIITDPDSAPGFELTGVDVYEIKDMDMVGTLIGELIKSKRYDVIIYNEEYSIRIPREINELMERSIIPVFVAIPSVRTSAEKGREREYIAELLHRALGFYIKLSR